MKYKSYLSVKEKENLQNQIIKKTGLKVEFHNDHLKITTSEWIK